MSQLLFLCLPGLIDSLIIVEIVLGQTMHCLACNLVSVCSGLQRQVFKHVPKRKWIPLTKIPWIQRKICRRINFVKSPRWL